MSWMRPKGAAKYINMSERTLRSLLKEGLPYSRLKSGTILISETQLDQWLLSFQVEGNETDKIVDEVCLGLTKG